MLGFQGNNNEGDAENNHGYFNGQEQKRMVEDGYQNVWTPSSTTAASASATATGLMSPHQDNYNTHQQQQFDLDVSFFLLFGA